jgi:hypothetical protein
MEAVTIVLSSCLIGVIAYGANHVWMANGGGPPLFGRIDVLSSKLPPQSVVSSSLDFFNIGLTCYT